MLVISRRSLRRYLVVTLLLGLISQALVVAQTYRIEDVPNVQLHDRTRLTSDPSGVLLSGEIAQIDAELNRIRSVHGVEFVVVVLPSIGDRDIERFATDLFRLWGVGSKSSNNGLLLLLVLDQRLVRFEVGYGLEGNLTDVRASQIQRRYMLPSLKREAYGEAILAATQAVGQLLSGTDWVAEQDQDPFQTIDWVTIFGFYCFFLLLVFISYAQKLNAQISQARHPEGARDHLPSIDKGFSSAILTFVLLGLPLAFVFLIWRGVALRRLKSLASICPYCHTETISLLPSDQGREALDAMQELEQRIGSRAFRVYACSRCQYKETCGTEIEKSPYTLCTACGCRAMETHYAERIYTDMGRKLRIYKRCLYCHHTNYEDRNDFTDGSGSNLLSAATLAALLSAHLSSGGRSGGSFGAGGFGGGGFGGGSSGGGGATSGW